MSASKFAWCVGWKKGSVSYVRNLLGQINGFGEGQSTSLNGALHVDVLDLLAQVRLGADQADQTVLDLQRNICALLNGLGDDT